MKPLTGVRFCLYCLSVLSLGCVPACGSKPARNTTGQKGAKSTRARGGRVQTGLDVLEAEKFAPLRGKHVGLITDHTGVDFQGRTNIELLARASGVQLVALFSPEHGIAGRADENVATAKDAPTGL